MMSPPQLTEALLAVAALLLLLGTYLCWNAARARMSEEEQEKDGMISEDQLRRRIRFIAWRCPVLVSLGTALLAFALLR